MVTRKDKRKSGYITPRATISKKNLMKNDLDVFIIPFYDDWCDCRDGFRDWFRDFKKIKKIHRQERKCFNEELVEKRIKMNLKQKKLLIRRKIKKKLKR